ncbi:MAG: hypothetical protein INH41_24930 [Myxococcaceae bacterium]|nr:hypothetical protein [Myxococcaceae bacterium]MCA3015645.1 hypothetical protein [Myxococcaceae bacterium]
MLSRVIVVTLSLGQLDVERQATIAREQARETAAVTAKYGNKKSTELSTEARAQLIRDLNAAEAKVLDKYGVSQRDWARAQMNRTREQAEAVKQAAQRQEAAEKAAAEQAERAQPAGAEVPLQRGFNDESPVILEEKASAQPIVEQGLPADYQRDQADAAEQDSLEKAPGATMPKAPAGKAPAR